MAIFYGRVDSEKKLLDLYPKQVQEIDDIAKVEAEMKNELKAEAKGIVAKFRKWGLKRQYKKFEKNRDDPFHAGAKGENKVIEKLSQLSDEYHVLCGVRIGLSYFISYKRKRNLRSAQIDFVVVSKKGVYAIEVKNWSDDYVNNQDYYSPHEQVGKHGRLLWHVLKSWRHTPRVTSVVLSIKGNIKYDPNYKVVFVTSLDKVNDFLENRQEVLSDKQVGKIIKKLKGHVTR